MTARTYRPEFDQSVFDRAQVGDDNYRQYAEQTLLRRVAARAKQALNVAPSLFHFYQRSYTGRRCSCFSTIESSPAASCVVCFGIGNTAGYQLHGTKTEVFEATAPAATVNTVLDFGQITRPLSYRLLNSAVKGYIDFTLPVSGGVNNCLLASVHALAPRGTRVRAACKLFGEAGFTPLSMQAITDRLEAAQTTGGIHLRIVLERDSVSAPSPRFSLLRIRYQTLDDYVIRGDIPRSAEGNRSSEFGWFDDTDTKSLYLDSTLRSVTSEDLFRHVSTGRLWKVFRTNPNAPADILTSWDVEMRLVQNSEKYARIP